MKKATFEKRVFEEILSDDFLTQAMEDLDSIVWAKDSVARAQFWEIGENENDLFGHVILTGTNLGHWPKEVEKTLIGYSNALFADQIEIILYRELAELFDVNDGKVSAFISHLCFMCCRCIAVVNARKDDLCKEDFYNYFFLVERKLKAYYQLDDFDENSFPKCELIALKVLYLHFDEIFNVSKSSRETKGESISRCVGSSWIIRVTPVMWSFVLRTAGKTVDIYLGSSGFEVNQYDFLTDPHDEEILLPPAISALVNSWYRGLLSGDPEMSSMYTLNSKGFQKGKVTTSWDCTRVTNYSTPCSEITFMNDELIEAILNFLKEVRYGLSD